MPVCVLRVLGYLPCLVISRLLADGLSMSDESYAATLAVIKENGERYASV